MRRALLVAGALLGSVAHAADAPPSRSLWSRLWQTDDQHAQRLLRDGDAAAAAQAFDDPRHRAFAQAQAGQHAEAAQAYSAFDDSDAHYNRGNALARSGDLQAALDAYDAALQRDPGNADAAHNRDLVRELLKQQQQEQQQGASGDKADSEPQQTDARPSPSSGGSSEDRSVAPSDTSPSTPDPGAEQQSASQEADATPRDDAPGAQEQSDAEEREQAERDARAGVAQQQQQQQQQEQEQQQQQNAAARAQGQATDDSPPPDTPQQGFEQTQRSEADLAADQWLQRIPDDPGGLLRRKFLMEHMLRQQEQQR